MQVYVFFCPRKFYVQIWWVFFSLLRGPCHCISISWARTMQGALKSSCQLVQMCEVTENQKVHNTIIRTTFNVGETPKTFKSIFAGCDYITTSFVNISSCTITLTMILFSKVRPELKLEKHRPERKSQPVYHDDLRPREVSKVSNEHRKMMCINLCTKILPIMCLSVKKKKRVISY